jgi:hypothetical protein
MRSHRSVTYRDPLAGLLSQVETKRASAGEKAKAVTPVVRALLPRALRGRIDGLLARSLPRDGAAAAALDLDTLTRVDADLDALLMALEEALALAPGLRECPEVVRDPPPPAIPSPWSFEEPSQLDLRRRLEARIQEIDAGSFLRRWGDCTYLARFDVEGARVVFMTTVRLLNPMLTVDAFESSLRATIPRALEALHLRPERVHHGIGKALGLAREITVGDAELDEAFFIRGAAASAAVVLEPRPRAGLIALRAARPALRAGDGVVDLAWSGPWRGDVADVLPAAALDVVLGIRGALVQG